MSRTRHLLLGAAALASLAALGGCSDTKELINAPTPTGGEMFRSYVAMGNSITAGLQSGGINDSTQKESYAYLLAKHLGTRFAYPALAMPGCPAPIDNFQTQSRVGGGSGSDCAFRTPTSPTAALNNVAVPNAAVADPTSSSTANSNALTLFVLGGKTQVQRALDADPTFVSIWIGNNDVLAAAVTGMLTPTPGISPGVTPQQTFEQHYDEMISQLRAGADHLQGGVLIGVVNAANAPILFPAAALLASPAFRAGFEAFTGGPVTVHPSCAGSTSLLSFAIVPRIRLYRQDPTAAGAHPPLIVCEKGQAGIPAPVGDVFILDATEQAELAADMTAINDYIESKATEAGFAFYDPNPALVALRQAGAIPLVPDLGNPTKPYGDYISLDGVHPAGPAHELIANELIDAINAKYNISIPPLSPDLMFAH
ncbi:MAG TPA: SGNH/GDSL hydrolase family protein [Gemmatimonadaceae bacterium]|nr:SGNH/GDSL hydrolase family protein [Gemmatimonadaceae bacterium]